MKERVILHCDANSFFASVEVANKPNLKNLPVAVAGNPKKRTGIILTKNHIAKKYGVETGEAIWQAKLKCPNLVLFAPHYKIYEYYSAKLKEIYEKYTDRVESFGIDECWLDVSDTYKFFGTPKELADKIRNEVKTSLNITISVGVSFCKLFAKLASDMKKPDATTIIDKRKFKEIIYPLPITDIIGIGRKLEKRYNQLGITKLGEITQVPDEILKKKFGILGIELKQKLLGYDYDEVNLFDNHVKPKSVGNGTTTIIDVYSRKEIMDVVTMLSEEISTRLRRDGFIAKGLAVGIKTATFEYFHKSKLMNITTNNSKDLVYESMNLIDSFWQYNQAVRAIRICTYNLSNANIVQLNMFTNIIKTKSIDNALDKIRKKYGYYSITPAIKINNTKLDMSRIEV